MCVANYRLWDNKKVKITRKITFPGGPIAVVSRENWVVRQEKT